MVRGEADFGATPIKAKISDAEQTRVHTMLVIGGRDMEAGAVSQGDLDGALAGYDKAIELRPNCGATYQYRSAVRKARGDIAGAEVDQKKAIELNCR